MRFEFATASAIVFGPGCRRDLFARLAALRATRAFLVTGRHASRAQWAVDGLAQHGCATTTWTVSSEPTIDDARRAAAAAREHTADIVIAIGGGSAIDLGKALAALCANDGDVLDYLEVIGRGVPLARPSLPFVAVPTTAGTGSEVTRNAVLASPADGVKVSMRSAWMLPTLALVDPELTLHLPPAITAATGMDALTQVIEPYVSSRATPMTDALCVDAIGRAAAALPRVVRSGDDLAARTDMAYVSVCGGIALANAGLGAVHGFAAPIGGRHHAPHGAVCAALLPVCVRANLDALRRRAPASTVIARFDTLARVLCGDPQATADDGIAWLDALRRDLAIPRLSSYGLSPADVPSLAAAAARASSMRGNPIALETGELERILHDAL